jgi:CHRD domain
MKRTGALLAIAAGGLVIIGIAVAGLNGQWRAKLSGEFEVPIRDTDARGQAVFHVSSGGTQVRYVLTASRISNVFQGHIHCGPVGVNGPIIVWLYPSTAPVPGPLGQGRTDGVLARGAFGDADVLDLAPGMNPACPSGADDLADVIALLNNGNAYVNVHTNDGVAPTNTGPGDFPGGEIRGQIE